MIAEMDAGHIATIIVKDLSRLGRDYLKVGYYTKIAFPEAEVRFIAITMELTVPISKKANLHHFLILLMNGTPRTRVRKSKPCLRLRVNRENHFAPYHLTATRKTQRIRTTGS